MKEHHRTELISENRIITLPSNSIYIRVKNSSPTPIFINENIELAESEEWSWRANSNNTIIGVVNIRFLKFDKKNRALLEYIVVS